MDNNITDAILAVLPAGTRVSSAEESDWQRDGHTLRKEIRVTLEAGPATMDIELFSPHTTVIGD
jgi:hypothetical protein